MRSLKILALAGVLLLVGTAGAFAQSSQHPIERINVPLGAEGTLYYRSTLFPKVEGHPGSLPTPVGPESTNGAAASGPVASDAGLMVVSPKGSSGSFGLGGGSLVSPSGSAFSSPKVRAEREIRRLIRRLD